MLQERKIAIAMCEADGVMPTEIVQLRNTYEDEPMVIIEHTMERWQMYLPEARRFLAALRACAM